MKIIWWFVYFVYGCDRKFDNISPSFCSHLFLYQPHALLAGYNSNIYVKHSVRFRHFVWVTRIRDRWQFPGHAIKSSDYFTGSSMNAYIRYTFSVEQTQQKAQKHWINVYSFEKRAKKYNICLIKTNSCCCSALYLMCFFCVIFSTIRGNRTDSFHDLWIEKSIYKPMDLQPLTNTTLAKITQNGYFLPFKCRRMHNE